MDRACASSRHESERGTWELVSRPPGSAPSRLVVEYEGYVERGARWAAAPAGADDAGPADRQFRQPVGGRRRAGRAACAPRQLLRRSLRPLDVRRRERPGELRPGQPHAARGAHVPRRPDARAREPHRLRRGRRCPTVRDRSCDRLEDTRLWERDSRSSTTSSHAASRTRACRLPRSPGPGRRSSERDGRAPIGWICDRLGRSRRHLATRFREQIGLPPKTVARILRFDRAVALLGGGGATLAELAFECGYYDQAHLNRDFRAVRRHLPGRASRARLVPDGGIVV